jgi:mannose/fructose/N-acetylgalactosamine-specific phosphotransferase system component IIB
MLETIHYPNLKTVLMVEDTLKKANDLMTREMLKKALPTKVMHQTLNVILKYLEDSGKILDGRKGILWIHNSSAKLDKAIKEGVEL